MAKSKVVKDALVEEEKIKKSKKEEEKVEEVKETKKEEKAAKKAEKAAKKEEKKKEKKQKPVKEKKDGYLRKLYKELKKVSWPSLGEVIKYSFAVILFCLIMVGFFYLVQLLATLLKSVV